MDNYYGIPAISSTGINQFVKSPMQYWKGSPFNEERDFNSDTDALRLGRLAHTLLLEPFKLDQEFIITPELNLRKKDDKELFETIKVQASEKGLTWVRPKEYEDIVDMINIAKENTIISSLLIDGKAEEPVYWTDEETGLKCKAKLDFNREGLVIDYKTSKSSAPEEFSKSIANFGYHRQAAFYMEAYKQKTGEQPDGFVFVVQDKGCYEDIAAFNIFDGDLELGKEENRIAMHEMAERLESGDWTTHPNKIQSIELPYWYKSTIITQEK